MAHLSSLMGARRAKVTLLDFPASTQKLATLVQANGGLFHRTPIGPLGLHLVVKDARSELQSLDTTILIVH